MTIFLDERITLDPEQCGGRPCIRGMRIRVSDVLDLLASGLTPEQVIEELPDLEPSDIRACLRFAVWLRRSPDTATADDLRSFQLHLSEIHLLVRFDARVTVFDVLFELLQFCCHHALRCGKLLSPNTC